MASDGPLTLGDIADARAYERSRDEFRARIVALKKIRRVPVGPVVTFVFENRDTIRFQVQEMARAERLLSDDAIQVELDTYNPLIPGRGALSASLFIALTSPDELDQWLPRLVGVERSARIVIGAGDDALVVAGDVDPEHAVHLTRETVTAAVHFVHFTFPSGAVDRFSREAVTLAVDHPNYQQQTALSDQTKASLLRDLLG